jgi:hypothetical protein
VPSNESFGEDARSRSSGATESDDQFASTVVAATDSQEKFELATDVPEVVVDNLGDTRSTEDMTDSTVSSGCYSFVRYACCAPPCDSCAALVNFFNPVG